MRTFAALTLVSVVAVVISVGCNSSPSGDPDSPSKMMGMPPFGGPDDIARAKSLWSEMNGYRSWEPYPGLEGFQDSGAPHGAFVRYFVNSTAARNTDALGNGSILVKENFMARDASTLGAITVMKRIAGYDPDTEDWFWVKFTPRGEVAKNPAGMALAGRVAKGMDQGCIACHENAGGDDYVYANDG